LKVSCEQEKLYRSNKPLSHILKCNENIHKDIFRESELKCLSPAQFKALLHSQLLVETYQDPEQIIYYDKNGTAYRIRKDDNNYIGYRIRGEGDATIVLSAGDKKHLKFNLKKFCQIIKTKNTLIGNIDMLSQRIWFLGSHAVLNTSLNVVLAFLCDDKTTGKELYALQSRLTQADKTIVLCPTHSIKSMDLAKGLQDKNIYCYEFNKILGDDFQIDFSKVPADEKIKDFKIPAITQKEKAGYKAHGYKCQDIIEFVDRVAKHRQVPININGKETDVPYVQAALLLYMVIKLKENTGGWVSFSDILKEDIIDGDKNTPSGKKGADDLSKMHKLVSPLSKKLRDFASKDIVELRTGESTYRISTHPIRVKEPSSNWLKRTYKHTVLPAVKAERVNRTKNVKH